MEVKAAAWGTVGLVIVAFGAVVIYAIEREGIKNDLTKASGELSSMKNLLETRHKSLADRQGAYAALQQRVALITATTERIKTEEGKNEKTLALIDQLRGEWAMARAAFARQIEQVRSKTKDETVASMTLADGNELRAVRFKEMKDTTVMLEHSAGIAKVALANMPKDWAGRLALGWNPKLTAELSGKPDEPEPEIPAAAPLKTAEMVRQEHRESVKRAGVGDAELKIKALERRIMEIQRARQAELQNASDYSRKYDLAQSKGNSSNHGVKRDEATRAAASLQNQIQAIQIQIGKLQEEIFQNSR